MLTLVIGEDRNSLKLTNKHVVQ